MSRFLFAVINFLLLAAIIYFVGRKMISSIFSGRLEKKGLPQCTRDYYNEGDVILDDEVRKKKSLGLIKFKKIHFRSNRK